MGIKKVAVIGSGLMGRQIALNTALHGFDVTLYDNSEEALKAAEDWTIEYLAGRLEKGRLTEEEINNAKSHIEFIYKLEEAVKDSDLVIEAIIEDRKIKEEFFTKLNDLVSKDTIIATNSSFMISSLFKDFVDNPSRLANLHYFNPALIMKLTEVVRGPHTSNETAEKLIEFSEQTGKSPVLVKKEIDGFLANRILRAVSSEALYLLDQDVASAKDIDTAVENGLNYPMGPFKLMDLVGVDLSYLAAKRQFEETGEKRPAYDILEKMYKEKKWGRKTGEGWYKY